MNINHISCADTAKLIRRALKEAFPDVKFGIRSKVYTGGASIRVCWTDGPNNKQVEAVASVFEGGYFDSMQDYKGSCFSLVDGQTTRFGADFIFCNRDYTDGFIAKAIQAVATKYAGNLKQGNAVIPTVAQYLNGEALSMEMPGMGGGYWGWSQLIGRRLAEVSDRMTIEKSKTAGKVIYLGNDGYSDIGALSQTAA